MSAALTYTYKGTEIEYEELTDLWRFHVRGRERSAKSLKNAKAAIDKPEPGEKKPFTPVEAIHVEYGTSVCKITITSVAENTGSGPQYWINIKGERRRVRVDTLFALSQDNIKAFNRIKAIDREVNLLRDEQTSLRDKMEHLVIEG